MNRGLFWFHTQQGLSSQHLAAASAPWKELGFPGGHLRDDMGIVEATCAEEAMPSVRGATNGAWVPQKFLLEISGVGG